MCFIMEVDLEIAYEVSTIAKIWKGKLGTGITIFLLDKFQFYNSSANLVT
jgi:hypothetical protein